MDFDDLPDVLTTMQELFQTERAFFATYRFMNPDTRDTIMTSFMRNSHNSLALLRHYMLLAGTQVEPSTVVATMDIPIRLDASGNFWDPINVRPTTEQIQAAVQQDVPVANETCAICQETVSVAARIRQCGHCFHSNCIREWFTLNARCPVCRHDIRELPPVLAGTGGQGRSDLIGQQAPASDPPPATEQVAEAPDWEWYINDGRQPIE